MHAHMTVLPQADVATILTCAKTQQHYSIHYIVLWIGAHCSQVLAVQMNVRGKTVFPFIGR